MCYRYLEEQNYLVATMLVVLPGSSASGSNSHIQTLVSVSVGSLLREWVRTNLSNLKFEQRSAVGIGCAVDAPMLECASEAYLGLFSQQWP